MDRLFAAFYRGDIAQRRNYALSPAQRRYAVCNGTSTAPIDGYFCAETMKNSSSGLPNATRRTRYQNALSIKIYDVPFSCSTARTILVAEND